MESNHVRDLMEAYSSIYAENEEVEQLDEEMTTSHPFKTGKPGIPSAPTLPAPTSGKPTVKKPSPTKSNIIQRLFQSVDLFDIIKGHLLDEGFADTEEAALAIMTNMSEDWKQSIVEQDATSSMADRARRVVANQRSGFHGDADALTRMQRTTERSVKRATAPLKEV